MGLSYQWRTVLTKLAEYGEAGIHEDAFCKLMGDDDLVRSRPCKSALDQMFFLNKGYYQKIPGALGVIRISEAGQKALADE